MTSHHPNDVLVRLSPPFGPLAASHLPLQCAYHLPTAHSWGFPGAVLTSTTP